ncbi:GNAT family N-acetyltransferase [Streptomyces sp. NRRL B-24484]|uniref:GNAT family N-acetyltransferase n=1 Tax=Streptomyces sp. NRRL B-24484 TaxID=1463833 RepID=UPI0004BEE23C|nr:GNAT family N-acetyltransferase [Streptomyces sp. NRRL B-24484]
MFTVPGTVRTPRLTLLPLRAAHAEEMADVLGDPALHAFIGGRPLGPDELRSRYERLVAGSPDPGEVWANWVVRLDVAGRLTGTVQATVTADGDGRLTAEIAWVVGTGWQRRGIATEAAQGLVSALAAAGVDRFVAHVHPEHRASAAVAAAAGLTPTDRLQDGEIRWESG